MLEPQGSRQIVLVANDKGGVGKTTTASQLAAVLAGRGPTTLLDTDIHKDTTGWAAARATRYPRLPQVTAVHETEFVADIASEAFERGHHVVLDVGGRDAEVLRVAMSVAHVLIIPIYPSQLDLFSCKRMAKRVAECRRWNPKLDAMFFINRAEPNYALRGMTDDALELCRSFAPIIRTAETVVHRRIAFVRAAGDGLGVHEMPGADQAAEELFGLLYDLDPNLIEDDDVDEVPSRPH